MKRTTVRMALLMALLMAFTGFAFGKEAPAAE